MITSLSWVYDLYRLGQTSSPQDNPRDIYDRILAHVVKGLGAESGSLSLVRSGERELEIVSIYNLPANAMGHVIPFGAGVAGLVAEGGEPMLLNGDVSEDHRFKLKTARSSVPASSLCWPLKVEGVTIGTLSANRGASSVPFAQADLEQGALMLNLVSLSLESLKFQMERDQRIVELIEAKQRLEETQGQLLQSEKMASIGQLAAGVAHEINNPVGYVSSNLSTLQKYIIELSGLLDAYAASEPELSEATRAAIGDHKQRIEYSYLMDDVVDLMNESLTGLWHVKKIVQDLKDFSHVDNTGWQPADLHKGMDATLNMVHNEIKYKAELVKEYGELPEVECLPSQINQVFMNMLVNAAHAIAEKGVITVRTGTDAEGVWVAISDTGAGIEPEHLKRIFEPFFTTKPVGKGTGLGLSLSYSIINKHHGRIEVESELGKGTLFRIHLPLSQPESQPEAEP